jgi:acyl-CoA carboxylase subunit beta
VFDTAIELSGDRAGGVDPVAVAAIARLGGAQRSSSSASTATRSACTVVAACPDRPRSGPCSARWSSRTAMTSRSSRSSTRTAPTPPPDRRRAGREAIAETFVAILSVDAPTIGVVTGEGGSGGALAIGATDRLLIQDDAFFSVISPEGAATILHRDPSRADDVVGHLRLRAHDLLELGVVDDVLPGPTTSDPERAAAAIRERIVTTLESARPGPGPAGTPTQRYGA